MYYIYFESAKVKCMPNFDVTQINLIGANRTDQQMKIICSDFNLQSTGVKSHAVEKTLHIYLTIFHMKY